MEEIEKNIKSGFLRFLFATNIGDLCYAMPSMRSICRKYNKKAIIYLRLNVKATYYEGAKHPNGDVMLTRKSYEMMRPLLMAQDWVEAVEVFCGDKYDIDMDVIRRESIGLPNGHIARWYFLSYPDMCCDLTEKWVQYTPNPEIVELVKKSIIVNFTERYRNNYVDYQFMNFVHKDIPILFAGTGGEFETFQKLVPRTQYLKVDDFDELACAIDNCKFFMGNQSFCYALAEGLKKDRIMEYCTWAQNCFPYGDNGYEFVKQNALEYYYTQLAQGLKP